MKASRLQENFYFCCVWHH